MDEPWNNSEFNRNTTFWHQNKKKESQKKCQKKKKEKTKRKSKRDWTGGFVGAVFLENQMGMPSPDWFCLRFGDDAKMSNEFTKIMSKRGAK